MRTGSWHYLPKRAMLPITDGQFTIVTDTTLSHWVIIQGRFGVTGTHASGTWEIFMEDGIVYKGTWESSQGSEFAGELLSNGELVINIEAMRESYLEHAWFVEQ